MLGESNGVVTVLWNYITYSQYDEDELAAGTGMASGTCETATGQVSAGTTESRPGTVVNHCRQPWLTA